MDFTRYLFRVFFFLSDHIICTWLSNKLSTCYFYNSTHKKQMKANLPHTTTGSDECLARIPPPPPSLSSSGPPLLEQCTSFGRSGKSSDSLSSVARILSSTPLCRSYCHPWRMALASLISPMCVRFTVSCPHHDVLCPRGQSLGKGKNTGKSDYREIFSHLFTPPLLSALSHFKVHPHHIQHAPHEVAIFFSSAIFLLSLTFFRSQKASV